MSGDFTLTNELPFETEPERVSLDSLPFAAQEALIIEDLLYCLMGIGGRYITLQTDKIKTDQISFTVDSQLHESLKGTVQRILPMCVDYVEISRFIEERTKFEYGMVTHSFCDVLNSLLKDHLILVVQLEHLHTKEQLTLQKMWCLVQRSFQTLRIIKEIIRNVSEGQLVGAQLINLLFHRSLTFAGDKNIEDLLSCLLEACCKPYMEMLQLWIYRGTVRDPFREFMIAEDTNFKVDTHYQELIDSYWEKRYQLRHEQVPTFLEKLKHKILTTGKYLNVVQECNQNYKDMALEESELPSQPKEQLYTEIIEVAYKKASKQLLDLLLKDYKLVVQLRTLKGYFLLEEGDFFVQFLDLAEDELLKKCAEINKNNLESVFELALRAATPIATVDITPSSPTISHEKRSRTLLKAEPKNEFIDNFSYLFLPYNLTTQVSHVLSIMSGKEPSTIQSEVSSQSSQLTGLESFSLTYNATWPVKHVLLNSTTLTKYQTLHRLLFTVLVTERQLSQSWSVDSHTFNRSAVRSTSWSELTPAHKLRHRMLHFVQTLEHYLFFEVIEPNWRILEQNIRSSETVDDLIKYHEEFLDHSLHQCLLTEQNLVKALVKLLSVCLIFSEYNARFLNTLATEIEEKRSQLLLLSPPTRPNSSSVQLSLMSTPRSGISPSILSPSVSQPTGDNSNQTLLAESQPKKEKDNVGPQQQQSSTVKPWQRKKLLSQQQKEPLVVIKETPKHASEPQQSQQSRQLEQLAGSLTAAEAYRSRREREKVIAKVASEETQRLMEQRNYHSTIKKFTDNFEHYLRFLLETMSTLSLPNVDQHFASFSVQIDFNEYYSRKFQVF
jgi:gamma-tubulin complex component 2